MSNPFPPFSIGYYILKKLDKTFQFILILKRKRFCKEQTKRRNEKKKKENQNSIFENICIWISMHVINGFQSFTKQQKCTHSFRYQFLLCFSIVSLSSQHFNYSIFIFYFSFILFCVCVCKWLLPFEKKLVKRCHCYFKWNNPISIDDHEHVVFISQRTSQLLSFLFICNSEVFFLSIFRKENCRLLFFFVVVVNFIHFKII